MRNAYLNLATLLTTPGEASAAQRVRHALDVLSPPVATVTLDLALSKDLFADADVESIVQVLHETWPTPAWCIVRCDNPVAWNRAAARLSQPLVAWRAFVKQSGYQVLGQAPRGTYATLLSALCTTHVQATAEQLAHDTRLVSPGKMNVDSHSIQQWVLHGQPPFGPMSANVSRIANDLRNMAQQRYIVQVSPGIFRAVTPTPPHASAR